MSEAALVLVLVCVAGYATQRGTTCAVAAAQEVVFERRINRLVGLLLCAFVSLGLLSAVQLVGYRKEPVFDDALVWCLAATGGGIFGVGAYLNGRCAFGTIATLGSGKITSIGTFVGFVGGSVLAVYSYVSQLGIKGGSPIIVTNASIMLILAVFSIIGLGRYLSANAVLTDDKASWSVLRAMVVIGVANGGLLILMQGWSHTSLLMAVARGQFSGLGWQAVIVVVLVAGAIAGAVVSKTFRFDLGNRLQWLKALCGGCLMGFGAVLVPGGNDRMLMLGFPLLLPGLIMAYAAMMAILIVMAGIERIYRRRAG